MPESFNLSPPEDSWKAATAGGDAPGQVFSSRVTTGREQQPHRIGAWRGMPGRYERPNGMPWSETFVVYKGTGTITFQDETFALAPGSIVNLRKGVPYVLEIASVLEKMAVITEHP